MTRPWILFLGLEVLAAGQRESHVLGDGERVEQGAGLENHGGAAADFRKLRLVPPGDVFARDEDAAFVRLKKPEQQLQRYRFPYAAAAHDHGGLTLLDEEIYVVQDGFVVEGF